MTRPFLFIQLKPYPEIEDDVVSSDFIGESCASVFGQGQYHLNNHFVKLVAWYDKEWVIPARYYQDPWLG
jgi:glyceraldehyde-3-phosphate dehydrogenase/erythrose-4-phosphate dehydrogenase